MINFNFYGHEDHLSIEWREVLTNFLFEHLGKYGDPREYIRKALDYALEGSASAGGCICVASEGNNITGVAVVNRTGMGGYIPENILVYIAVHTDNRGKGLGRELLTEVIRRTRGGIALHVEPDNPAFFLYRNLGFVNKYLEMRLKGEDGG